MISYDIQAGEDDEDEVLLYLTVDKTVSVICGDEAEEEDLAIDANNFPDKRLRKTVRPYDVNGDGKLSKGECVRVTRLEDFVTSVEGIQHFPNLRELCVSNTSIASIDLSMCSFTKLKKIQIDMNGSLKTVILGNLPSLTELNLNGNALTRIDLSGAPALKSLYIESNKLSALDVSGCPNLNILSAYENRLTSLTLGAHPSLNFLNVPFNKLTSLTVSDFAALEELCVTGNPLTELDVSQNPALEDLDVSETKLSKLNISANVKLKNLYCDGMAIKALNVSKCPKLVTVLKKGECSIPGSGSKGINCEASVGEVTFPVGAKITYGTRVMKSMAVSKSTSASLYISDRLALKAAAGRIKKITAISNKKVVTAKLYDGALTINGKAHGKSAVTFTTTKGKTFKVTVTVTDPTMPKKVALDKTKAVVYLGHPVTLKATMTPSRSDATAKSGLTWKTSNAKIAKVSTTGKVTAVKAGTAKITVTTARGKKTATCTVTVRDPNLPKSIALDQKAVTVYAGEVKNIRLKSTLSWWVESYATAKKTKVTWTSSNKAVATVNGSGVVTPLKAGKVTITAKTVNGKSAACVVTITRNRIDNIHAAPTKAQIKKMASVFPCGYLKSVEIVNRNKIVLEWYLMNGKSKPLAKTPTMSMHVRYAKDVVEPATDEEDIVDEEELSESIVLTDYDYKTVNVPANNYKLITVTLTPGNCYRFKSDIKLSTVKAKLDWYFDWCGE